MVLATLLGAAALVASTASLTMSPAHAAPSGAVIRVTDVSPNAAYGSPGGRDADPSGRVMPLIVDPSNAQVLFTASEASGVWMSSDGAKSWHQSSQGLRNGVTAANQGGSVDQLAIDDRNSRRLLYASADEDIRPGHPFGGVYASTDHAGSWHKVDLDIPKIVRSPSGLATVEHETCTEAGVNHLQFSGGVAYVLTRCGLLHSSDLQNWRPTAAPGPFTGDTGGAFKIAGNSIFACSGPTLWFSPNLGATWPVQATPNPSNCEGLAPLPSSPSRSVATIDDAGNVAQVDFTDTASTTTSHGALNDPGSDSGTPAIVAVPWRTFFPVPGLRGYDLFASQGGFNYHQESRSSPGTWLTINGPHVDTWGFAASPNYSPLTGNCTAYMATDGGVFANTGTGVGCVAAKGPWVRASNGLHVQFASGLAGASSLCFSPPFAIYECPSLSMASADNGTWASTGTGTWTYVSDLGDTGNVMVDGALPGQVATTRNYQIELTKAANGSGATKKFDPAWSAGPSKGQSALSHDPLPPPQQPTMSQVMSLPGEAPGAGDYFAIEYEPQPCNSPGLALCTDTLVRNQSVPTQGGAGWKIATSAPFAQDQVSSVQPAGGHSKTVVYVLTQASGDRPRVQRGQIDSSGTVASWAEVDGTGSATLDNPADLFVDPYDPTVLYATDVDSGAIKTSSDSGQHWSTDQTLTRLATNHGEYDAACPKQVRPLPACMLTHMAFVRGQANLRFATLFPGGLAFSRDAGAHWIPLIGATSNLDIPAATWFDAGLLGSSPALYVAEIAHGVQRIDAPFATLEALTYDFTAFPGSGSTSVVDETTGRTLFPGAATELVDAAQTPAVRYHFVIDGAPGPSVSRSITPSERKSGVARIAVAYVPGTPITATPSPRPDPRPATPVGPRPLPAPLPASSSSITPSPPSVSQDTATSASTTAPPPPARTRAGQRPASAALAYTGTGLALLSLAAAAGLSTALLIRWQMRRRDVA